MKLSKASVIMYVALVFASGVVLGGFGHRLYTVSVVSAKTTRDPEEFRRRYLAEMETRLHLTAEELTRLNTILDEGRARVREVHERVRPEVQNIRAEQQEKIRAMLRPEQRPEYDKMRQERLERQKNGDRSATPPTFR